MKINSENSIQGIFKFYSSAEYEEDDLVLYNGKLYICIKNTKNDVKTPNKSSCFKEYLEDDTCSSIKEWKDFTENSGGYDKPLSLSVFREILETYNSGVDPTTGSFIEVSSEYSNELLNNTGGYISGTYIVSSDDSGFSNYLSPSSTGILKQYSYKIDDSIINVQTLLDPSEGDIWVRSNRKGNSSWKSITTSTSLKTAARTLENELYTKRENIDNFNKELNKRYRNVCIYDSNISSNIENLISQDSINSIVLTNDKSVSENIEKNSTDTYTYYVPISGDIYNIGPLIVNVTSILDDSQENEPRLFSSNTITVNLSDEAYTEKYYQYTANINQVPYGLKATIEGKEYILARKYKCANVSYYINSKATLKVETFYKKIKLTVVGNNSFIRSVSYRKYYNN